MPLENLGLGLGFQHNAESNGNKNETCNGHPRSLPRVYRDYRYITTILEHRMEQNNGPSHGNGYGDVPGQRANGVGLGFAWTMDVLDFGGIPCKKIGPNSQKGRTIRVQAISRVAIMNEGMQETKETTGVLRMTWEPL